MVSAKILDLDIVNNRIVIGNLAITDIVEKYGSPLFAYRAESIRRRISVIKDAIKYPRLQLSYAVRANPALAILRLLYREGLNVSGASIGEVMAAFKACFPPHQILAVADLLTDSEMEFCYDRNVHLSFGSIDSIVRFGMRHRGKKIVLRIRPSEPENNEIIWNDIFGIKPDALDEAIKAVGEYGLGVFGIHVSDTMETNDAKRLGGTLETIFTIAQRFEELTYVNVGGGFGVALRAEDPEFDIYGFGEILTKRMNTFAAKVRKPITLVAEPGRYLVSDSGYLFMKVIALRDHGKIKRAVVDASTYNLPDIRLQNRYYEIGNASNPEAEPVSIVISGCGTDGGDCFTPAPREVADVRVGDILAVRSTGTFAMGYTGFFNMRPRPAEIMLEEGRERLIRKRETIDDLLRNQNW
ncbi:MAG: hypothetical protein LBC99_08725 [Spirochaetota bacterium]|jgi:diaminopimelate decarboxylase|nr:hypothetical protein [Spirochaetota bacterium]